MSFERAPLHVDEPPTGAAVPMVPCQRTPSGGDLDAALSRIVVGSLPGMCVMVLDRDLRCCLAGGAAAWPGGIDPAELCGRHVRELLPSAHWERTRAHYEAALGGATIDERQPARDGRVYRTVYGPARDGDQVVGVIVRFREVGPAEDAERRAADALELFELCFASAPIGNALVGPDGRFLKVNPALCALVGRSEEQLLACSFQDITHPDDLAADLALYSSVLDGGLDAYRMDKRYLSPTGEVVPVQLDVAATRNPDGSVRLFVAQIQDISDRKQTESVLRDLATRDPLTGLWNRAWFSEELDQALDAAERYGHRPALMLIDLDRFKEVNDTHGHRAGDEHLCAVASVLSRTARRSDRVSRLGGDEFAVLLPSSTGAAAAAAAVRYADALRQLRTGHGASVGIATYRPGDDAELLFDRADQDMYRAKRAAAHLRELQERTA